MICLTLRPVMSKRTGQIMHITGECDVPGLESSIEKYGPWTQTLGGAIVWKITVEQQKLTCVLGSRWTHDRRGREAQLAVSYTQKKLNSVADSLLADRGRFLPLPQIQRLLDPHSPTYRRKKAYRRLRQKMADEHQLLVAQARILREIYVEYKDEGL